jgi:hypothetical protein
MEVDIKTEQGLSAGNPRLLFRGEYDIGRGGTTSQYDVSPDGKKFVMIQNELELYPTEFQVVQNWFQELKRLVPTN